MGRRLRDVRPAVILAVGWALHLLYAFPGIVSVDSMIQLDEARKWSFTDDHPPVMALIWGVLDRIIPGPIGMLLLQSGSFLVGVYLILCRAMRPRRAALCACAILLFPPIIAPMAVIWKDSLMAGVVVLGIPLVLDPRRKMRVLALVLFALGTALRYNALAATLPLTVLLFEYKIGQRWFTRYAISAAAWLLVVATAMGCNALITDKEMHYWHSSCALADITGVLAKVDRDMTDDELRPLLAPTSIRVDTNIHAAVRAHYKAYDYDQLIDGDDKLWEVSLQDAMEKPRRDAVQHAWTELVTEHPGAYLRYRLDYFAEAIGLRRKFQGVMVVTHKAQNQGMLDTLKLAKGSSRFQDRTQSAVSWLAKRTRLFRPHVYLVLTLALLVFTRRQRDVFAILMSGLFMELTLIPLGWTPDFRFSHWLITCTCISLVMLIARRVRPSSVDLGAQDGKLADDVG